MANILPFQRTSRLIGEIDEYIDKVFEAAMVLERSILHYLDKGPDDELDEKVDQIRVIEERADELRRNVANVMYSEMLMPDARGDVLNLLDQVDTTLDDCVHMLVKLAMERPDLSSEFIDGYRAIMGEVSEAIKAMLRGARLLQGASRGSGLCARSLLSRQGSNHDRTANRQGDLRYGASLGAQATARRLAR